MGQTLAFDELKDFLAPVSTSVPNNVAPPISSSSDEDEDDFDGYFENVNPKASIRTQKVFYLSTCVEVIRNQHSTGNAYEALKDVLEDIPSLVLCSPSDGVDTSSSLVAELIRLANPFKMENFDSLRDDAVLSLLRAYPLTTLPVISDMLASDSANIGEKTSMLTILSRAAEQMNHLSPNNRDASGVDSKAALVTIRSNKTIVKRPEKLRILNEMKGFYRNNLGDILHLYFDPPRDILLRLLATSSGSAVVVMATDSQRRVIGSKEPYELYDGIDIFLPTQAFITIASIVKCSFNTLHQRSMYLDTIKLCMLYKSSKSLSLRSSVLAALCASLDSWLQMRSRFGSSKQQIIGQGGGAIEALMDVFGQQALRHDGGIAAQDDKIVMDIADWAITALADGEVDPFCKHSIQGIIKIAIEAFENK